MRNGKPLFLLIPFLIFSCKPSSPNQASKPAKTSNRNASSSQSRNKDPDGKSDKLIEKANKQIGVKYKLGGNTPSGFDCSGFTFYIFNQVGIVLPNRSADQAKIGKWIAQNDAQKGDLIFFKGSDKKSKEAGHVGIVIENKQGNISFVHASSSKGIRKDDLTVAYFKERFMFVKRVW